MPPSPVWHLHDQRRQGRCCLHTRPLGACRQVTGQHVWLARRCGVALLVSGCGLSASPRIPTMSWDVYADASVCERGPTDIVAMGGDTRHGLFRAGSLRPLVEPSCGPDQRAGAAGIHFSLDIPSGLSGLTGVRARRCKRRTPPVTAEAATNIWKPRQARAGCTSGPSAFRPGAEGASRFLSDDHESHCRSFSGSRSGVAQRGPPGLF